MTMGTAKWIFENLEDEKYSDKEKLEAIKIVSNMETHNSVTKKEMLAAIKWLMDYEEKNAWILTNDGQEPKTEGLYLLTLFNNGEYTVGAIRNDGNWKSCIDVEGKVIAWKKPQPYIPFEELGGE